jgi:hypothetical protein
VNEAARLRSAPRAYVYFIHHVPQYTFRSAIFYDSTLTGPGLSDEHKQFEVVEDTSGGERDVHMYSGRTATEKSVFWYPGMQIISLMKTSNL